MPSVPIAPGSTTSWRSANSVMPARRRPRHASATHSGERTHIIDWVIVGLMLVAVITTFTISSSMLTAARIHYVTTGGNFYEKLHPATYFTLLALGLLLIRNSDPIGEINRIFSEAKPVLVYLLCWLALLVQMVVLERPFTAIIDTFLQPLVICLVAWRLPPAQRRPLVWALHLALLLNVVLGYYEYFSGHRLFPLTLGDVVVMGEWRSAAFLGHPLTASGIVGGYVLALVLRPALCPPLALRLPLIVFCMGSLMVFGGRTSLVTVLALIACFVAAELFQLLRGRRISLLVAVGAICLLFVMAAGVFTALDLGIFDKMLLRFSSDKGSTFARYATLNLLSHFDWHELVLGPSPVRVNALQSQWGLNYGIENFWISCIVQFGIIHTLLLNFGLACLLAEILRRADRAAWAILLLMLVIAASSVSFSSKNIQLAQFIFLITLMLPRERRIASTAAPAYRGRVRPVPAYRGVQGSA
jgi:hypothetical protein